MGGERGTRLERSGMQRERNGSGEECRERGRETRLDRSGCREREKRGLGGEECRKREGERD